LAGINSPVHGPFFGPTNTKTSIVHEAKGIFLFCKWNIEFIGPARN
jgi:hypothetical protein